MSFNGGIKFFDKSKTLGADGSTMTASSGSASVNNAIDRNPLTVWRSVASDDSTVETLIITPANAPIIVDRLFCIGINWLNFDIEYDSTGGAVWTDFTSVQGLDTDPLALDSQIDETAFADNTAYYQFDSVAAHAFRIRIDTTQVVDDQKFLNQFIATSEIGTLVGYPQVQDLTPDRNTRVSDGSSGRKSIVKSIETFSVGLDFADYPAGFGSDMDLMFQLFDLEDPFLTWLAGGNRGSSFFTYTLRGYRLQDVIPMQIVNAPSLNYFKNIYLAPVSLPFQLSEAVL